MDKDIERIAHVLCEEIHRVCSQRKTPDGLVLQHAIDAGLVKENPDGTVENIAAFDVFWNAVKRSDRLWSEYKVEKLHDYGTDSSTDKRIKKMESAIRFLFGFLGGGILSLLLKAVFR